MDDFRLHWAVSALVRLKNHGGAPEAPPPVQQRVKHTFCIERCASVSNQSSTCLTESRHQILAFVARNVVDLGREPAPLSLTDVEVTQKLASLGPDGLQSQLHSSRIVRHHPKWSLHHHITLLSQALFD